MGYSLMGFDGLGFDDGDIAMFCGAADGIDDDISVRLHGRSLVLGGWFRHLYPCKAKDSSILCHARTLGELISAF
ncbi:hypothetical protein FRC0323_01782 [Corynebacterium diphtheriae]|nr:hypothetical protein FRC0323_01782 [Corynebacterium diphtheriae]